MKYFYLISIILLNYIATDDDIMNFIIDNIYLGDSTAASNEVYLKSFNIDTVVNCAEELVSEYKDLKFMELNYMMIMNKNYVLNWK